MSIKLFAPLAVAGSGLVASNSMWFFVSEEEVKPAAITPQLETSTIEVSTIETPPVESVSEKKLDVAPDNGGINSLININGFSASDKLNKKGIISKDPNVQVGKFIPNSGVYWKINGDDKDYYISILQNKLDDFTLNFFATRDNYLKFNKDEIKINLFSKAAWYSDQQMDEFNTEVDSKQIKELFELGLDEVKVKQLLLSLHKHRYWARYLSHSPITFWSNLKYSSNMEILKELKIKYFGNFESLKDYVQEKVKSCVDDDKSCVAHPEELNFMDIDKFSYFENLGT